jgi:ketol-acid reductoisomerase
MTKIFYDNDADIKILEGKRIGIIGYGNQGRAQALNMKDSGIRDILVGTAKDATYDQAIQDGFQVMEIPQMVTLADIIFMLVPDEIMPKVYSDHVHPNLSSRMVLNFASGYNITFKQIIPPEDVDIVMVAPRMIGDGVRNLFQEGKGYPAFVAVEQDASGSAMKIALGLAKVMGATKKGTIEVSFKDETMMDLLAEQAIWPMILSVITEAYKFEVEKGHPAEASLVELYLSKEPAIMFEKFADMGLYRQMPLHSHTSQYGQLTRAEMLDKSFIRKTLEDAYAYLENGEFAREWKQEQENGLPEFKRLTEQALNSDISRLEDKLINL